MGILVIATEIDLVGAILLAFELRELRKEKRPAIFRDCGPPGNLSLYLLIIA